MLRSSGGSSLVSRCGPRTWVASVSSWPSAVSAALGRHRAGVVDDRVQRALPARRELADRRQQADVELVDDDLRPGHVANDLVADAFAFGHAADDHVHLRAQLRQPGDRGAAEPGLRAGDDHDLAVDPRQRPPGPLARAVADVGVADQGAIEHRVHEPRHHGAMDADVIVVGGGLAGLVATAELADAGRRVILLEQEPEASLGGQAFWSLGGLFLVDSPEQRRLRIKDSRDLAWQDWLGTAGFDRPDDEWPRRWAEAYVDFAAGEKRAWLGEQGIKFVPNVGWAERGGYGAIGHGNSVPRFHVTWGTGPGVVEPFVRRVRDGGRRHALPPPRRRADGHRRRGRRRERHDPRAGRLRARASSSNRDPVGAFELRAGAVIVTSGGIGGNHELVRRNWPERLGTPPKQMISGVPAHVDGRMIAITRAGRRRGHPPRPHVALHRGHPQLGPDLAAARHPDPARPVVAVARRDRHPAAGAAVPRLRHARHARPHHDDRPRPHVVRADAEDHREGVRALRLRAEPRHHRQERARAAASSRVGSGAPAPVEAFKQHGEDFVVARDLRALVDGHEPADRDAAAGLRDRRGARSSPATASSTTRTPRTCRSPRSTARAATSRTASPASPRRTSCSTRTPAR